MRKYLIAIILAIALPFAHGLLQSPTPVDASGDVVLATGTVTLANTKLSLADSYAFFDFSTDMTPWIGETIEICPATAASKHYCIRGRVSSLGTGETLGAEKSTGTLTIGLLYVITATESNHFGTGYVIGRYFTASAATTCDANNKVQQATSPSSTGHWIKKSAASTTDGDGWSQKSASFLANDSAGYYYRIIKSKPMGNLTTSGTVTSSNVHLATVDAGAMVEISGVDLSAYAGGDDNASLPCRWINPHSTIAATWKTNRYLLALYDSSGKMATGYIGGPGAGETLGSELVTNGTWDTNTSGWTPSQATIASIAGGYSNNCLEVTRVEADTQRAMSSNIPTSVGQLLRVSYYVKSGTAGDRTWNVLLFKSTSPYTAFDNKVGTTTASWVNTTFTKTNTVGTLVAYVIKYDSTAGTMLFDELSVKQVTDISKTGIHLHSTPNGYDRKMARVDSGFNPNGVTSYKIYQVGPSGYDLDVILDSTGYPIISNPYTGKYISNSP